MSNVHVKSKTLSLNSQKKPYDYLIALGRYQPFHTAHLAIIKQALEQADTVIVVVGSSNASRTVKNPFTAQERMSMIAGSLSQDDLRRVHFGFVSDRLYSEQQWIRSVQEVVEDQITHDRDKQPNRILNFLKIGIIGHSKDESSYYLKSFPQWKQVEVDNIDSLNATDIRTRLFETDVVDESIVPVGTADFIREFKQTDTFEYLKSEYDFIQQYKKSWENAPYAPTFVTTDACIIQSGHVLLIRRRAAPSAGTLALPGGFVDPGERIEDAMLRELREETKIKVPAPVLRGSIKSTFVADAPGRSLRGRTISHVYHIELPPGPLPKVKGSDDAEKAMWVPLSEIDGLQDQMFEDHYDLIQHFIGG